MKTVTEQMRVEFKDYICSELCKHTGKREESLLKQCVKCKVDEYLKGMKKK